MRLPYYIFAKSVFLTKIKNIVMKKIIGLLMLLSLFFISHAQISLGLKAGLNNNLARTSDAQVTIDPLSPGFYAGALVNDMLADHIALQVELFYSEEGSKFKQKGNPTVYTDKIGYFNIPVLFQFRTHGGFYLETGPQLGFLLSASQSVSGSSESIKSGVNGTKFSWCFGLGQVIAKKVGIGIRYAVGLSDVNKDSQNGGSVKDGVLSIGLSYMFKLK
jgi:hypothetical protein